MLRFFRGIRKTLMEQNKTRTYLLYAVGEIALVMIGILLALQVNNWNEERKLIQTEQQLLIDIKENLISSRQELITGKELNEVINNNNLIIYRAIEQDLVLTDSIQQAFASISNWHSPFFTYTAYESLKSKGLDLVRNQDLKKKIAQMYDRHFEFLVNDYDKAEWAAVETKKRILVRHVRFSLESGNTQTTYPVDFEVLKKDVEFANMLSNMIQLRDFGINAYQQVIDLLDELIVEIEQEIK